MQEGKKLKNLNMAISGDLRGSRTIHSFVYALARFGADAVPVGAAALARYRLTRPLIAARRLAAAA